MKILFVTDYYPSPQLPQFCIYIQQQAQALIELGHTVEVMVPSARSSFSSKYSRILLAGVNVLYSEYSTLYKGIYCYPVLIKNILWYEKITDFNQYDIISIQMFQEDTLRIFLKIAKRHKLKTVIHYHGLSMLYDRPPSFLVGALQRRGDRVLKRLIRKADAIVGVSDKVKNKIHSVYPDKPAFTVYNGVDTGFFLPKNRKEDTVFRIVTVASLKKIKGNHYLIEAVKLLTLQYPEQEFKLFIIGIGPEEEHLKELAAASGLQEVICFMGYVSYEEVAQIIRSCDVFAMPSYYEALGCAYLEAMACRLPVIGCRCQGIDEIITDGVNGVLIEPHNVNQLYEKLSYLYKHPDIAAGIGQKGCQTVAEHFTWQASAKQLLAVYQEITGIN